MIDSIVTFKWHVPNYRSKFTADNVNTSFSMCARNYPGLKRFICVTDDAEGLHPDIEVVSLWNDFSNLQNPTWRNGPSCYRRLPVFAESFRKVAGDKFVCIDLDWVATGDLRPLFNRPDPFVIWGPENSRVNYCAAMFMLQAGYLDRLHREFDPRTSPQFANARGFRGSDQGWIMCWAARNRISFPTWTMRDGVYGYRDKGHLKSPDILPEGARVVIFCGKPDPWDAEATSRSPWIKEHYR
jgi:hypothetical protein